MDARVIESSPVMRDSEAFQSIYLAAKARDANTIIALTDRGISIDVKDAQDILTPAGRLAAEDDRKSVAFLLDLGASLNEVARGASYGNNQHFVKTLRDHHPFEPAFFFGETSMTGFIWNQNKKNAAYATLRKHIIIHSHIFAGAWQAGRFSNEASALRELSLISNRRIRYLFERALTTYQEKNERKFQRFKNLLSLPPLDLSCLNEYHYDLPALFEKADALGDQFNKIMHQHDMSVTQCLAWTKLELQTWFLEADGLIKQKSLDYTAFILIGAAIGCLSYEEAEALYQKTHALVFRDQPKPIVATNYLTPFFDASRSWITSTLSFFQPKKPEQKNTTTSVMDTQPAPSKQ